MADGKEKITVALHVSINGKYILLNDLPEQERKKIITELNDRGMRNAGYVPVAKKNDIA